MLKLRILLLCDRREDNAATVKDHIDSLSQTSAHHVQALSILGDLPPALSLDHYDALVVHYSLTLKHDGYVSAGTRKAISSFNGLKALFIQDEYRFVNASIDAMREIGIKVLFTCVPEQEIPKVYPEERLPGVKKVNVLTGYVPEQLLNRPVPRYSERPIDVGYRARKLPAWLGTLGREKCAIGERFKADAQSDGLKLDISIREEDRIYGDAWIDFVCHCKSMLGVESGASVFDFTGEIQAQVDAHVGRDPSVTFEELHERYLKDFDGRITLNQISPRCFEAAALRTLMVLYEGDYSGRLEPGRHYVPLKKDHSNHQDVVSVLKDPQRAQEIIDRAYMEVAQNQQNSFGAFVREFDATMADAFKPEMAARLPPLSPQAFARQSRASVRTRALRGRRRMIEFGYRFVFGTLLHHASGEFRNYVQWRLERIVGALKRNTGRSKRG